MKIYSLLLIFLLSAIHANGMKKNHGNHKSPDAQAVACRKYVEQARASLEKACITAGPALEKHLNCGLQAVERALKQSTKQETTQELTSLQALMQGMQGFQQNKNPDEILDYLVDVINTPSTVPLIKQMKSTAFGLVVALADEKKHMISNFYWIKHLLKSEPAELVCEGLTRFDALFAPTLQEHDYQGMSALFKHSQILADIKELAEVKLNAQAQLSMAKYHFYIAKWGKDPEGSEVNFHEQLQRAERYAQLSGGDGLLLKEIQKLTQEHEKKKAPEEAAPIVVISTQKAMPNTIVLTLKVPPLQKVVPLKMLCALEIMKHSSGRQGLGYMGKKMLQDDVGHVQDMGLSCLKQAAFNGNPFAAERVGDVLRSNEPDLAYAFYAKALHGIRHAPASSLYKLAGCFRVSSLESKLNTLSVEGTKVALYQQALECARSALIEKELYGVCNKNHIDLLARTVHTLETDFVHNKHTVDTQCLELLNLTGVIGCMEQLRQERGVLDVLLTACALRAHVGRGFILKEKTILAHYKKALHIILDPRGASHLGFNDPVSDELLLKKIAIDQLPVQHRILYIEAMLGVIEQLIANHVLLPKEADYVCQLFFLVDGVLHETNDANLRGLHISRYSGLLPAIGNVAKIAGSGDYLYQLGLRCIEQGNVQAAYALITEAEPLCTACYQTEQGKTAERKKQLSRIKNMRALVLWQQDQVDDAYELYRQALQYNYEDPALRWDIGERLVQSGNPAWRQEGLAIIAQLARSSKHRKSLEFMAACYGGEKQHLMALDIENAILCLQQLIKGDSREYAYNRLKLAILYKAKSNELQGHQRKLLLTRALDLLSPYKNSRPTIHIQYMDILALLEKNQEIMCELNQYALAKESSLKEILEVADCYNKHANNESIKPKVRTKLRDRAETLLRAAAEISDDAYYKLLELLLLAHKFPELHKELQREKGQHMVCIQESLKACALLEEHGLSRFDTVLEHTERSFEVYQTCFGSLAIDDRASALVDLLMSLEESSAMHITHPMKNSSLAQINKLLDMIHLLIIKGECTDAERCRILAYLGYLNVKLTLVKSDASITEENVMAMLKKAAEVARKTTDVPSKEKLLSLIQTRIDQFQTKENGNLSQRVLKMVQLIVMCASVCKGTDAAISNKLLYDRVVQVKSFVENLDITGCTAEDIAKIKQQQALLVHILERNCIKK